MVSHLRSAKGQQGETAQNKVQAYLNTLGSQRAVFDWERRYDPKSFAGKDRHGNTKIVAHRQTYDFAFFWPERHGGIEVKSTEHAYRLPKANFPLYQRALLRKRIWAGGLGLVLVYHEEADFWRLPPFKLLDDGQETGSWDLTTLPVFQDLSLVNWPDNMLTLKVKL